MYINRKKRNILIIGICLSALLLVLLLASKSIGVCHDKVLFPSIKEIGRDHITLQINDGIELTPWESYRLELFNYKVFAILYKLNQQGADFLYYERFNTIGEAAPPTTITTLCKKHINRLEVSPQPYKQVVWLQPMDFIGWTVKEYIEVPSYGYWFPLKAQKSRHIRTQIRNKSSGYNVSYESRIDVEIYGNAVDAKKDYKILEEWKTKRWSSTNSIKIDSPIFDQHIATARVDWGTIGEYLGLYQNCIFLLNLELEDYHLIPENQRIEDIQNLIFLLEKKAISDSGQICKTSN